MRQRIHRQLLGWKPGAGAGGGGALGLSLRSRRDHLREPFVKAVLLAGGPVGKLPLEAGDTADSKGLVRVGGQPLAWRTLQGFREARLLTRTVLVGGDCNWEGVDRWVPAQATLMGSFEAGVNACEESSEPVLVCCGDLPFLPGAALDDFVARCRQRPEASLWYGYLRQQNSQRKYPRLPHTWARLQDGTYCGSGVMVPTSAKPKPSPSSASGTSAFLS